MGSANIDILREASQDQRGLITTAQASELGVSRKRLSEFVADGRVDRIRHGLYLVVPAPEDEHRELRIAWILLDPTRFGWDRLDDDVPTGVISHRSAARMQHLGDLDADIAELTTARRVRLRLPHTRLRTAELTNKDWTVIDGLPVTTAVRTVADLAAARTDAGHLAGVVLDALLADYTTLTDIAEALDKYAMSYGYRSGSQFAAALVRIIGVPRNTHVLAEVDRPASASITKRPSDLFAQMVADSIRGEHPEFEMPEGLMPKFEMPEGLMPKFEMPEGLMPKFEMSDELLAGILARNLLAQATIEALKTGSRNKLSSGLVSESSAVVRPRSEHADPQQDDQDSDRQDEGRDDERDDG
ncbi:type IV toxin-antitoxin system AbiEi family antitoxin domain-containing protein [Nocardiaceae bacterium NPDC056970]